MTVKHLQTVQRQQLVMAVSTDPSVVHKFKSGFVDCAEEVNRYISQMDGVDVPVKQRLINHLTTCITGLQQLSPFGQFGNNGVASVNAPTPLVQSNAIPTLLQQHHDINNNTQNGRINMGGVQFIPSRLPTGELALVMPNSNNLPFTFTTTTNASTVQPSNGLLLQQQQSQPTSTPHHHPLLSQQSQRISAFNTVITKRQLITTTSPPLSPISSISSIGDDSSSHSPPTTTTTNSTSTIIASSQSTGTTTNVYSDYLLPPIVTTPPPQLITNVFPTPPSLNSSSGSLFKLILPTAVTATSMTTASSLQQPHITSTTSTTLKRSYSDFCNGGEGGDGVESGDDQIRSVKMMKMNENYEQNHQERDNHNQPIDGSNESMWRPW